VSITHISVHPKMPLIKSTPKFKLISKGYWKKFWEPLASYIRYTGIIAVRK
jgi:hypothetical protein